MRFGVSAFVHKPVSGTGEETRDKLGAFVGKSGRTLEKQVPLVEAAEAEPEKYAKLVADMDRTGRLGRGAQ